MLIGSVGFERKRGDFVHSRASPASLTFPPVQSSDGGADHTLFSWKQCLHALFSGIIPLVCETLVGALLYPISFTRGGIFFFFAAPHPLQKKLNGSFHGWAWFAADTLSEKPPPKDMLMTVAWKGWRNAKHKIFKIVTHVGFRETSGERRRRGLKGRIYTAPPRTNLNEWLTGCPGPFFF